MTEDNGPGGGPELEALVHRARTGLRDWTDQTDSDPGVALLELFAYVGELLAAHSDRVAAEAHLGSQRRGRSHSSVVRQRGRVSTDADPSEEAAPAVVGVHRALVLDDADPLSQHRLRVQVPGVPGSESIWAQACLTTGTTMVPATGDGVWVAFEAGDPSRPVWLGQRVTSASAGS